MDQRKNKRVGDQDSAYEYGEMILAGLDVDDYADNGTECFYEMMWFSYDDMVSYAYYIDLYQTNGLLTDIEIGELVDVMQNFSNHLWVCSDFMGNLVDYAESSSGDFDGVVGYMSAFF